MYVWIVYHNCHGVACGMELTRARNYTYTTISTYFLDTLKGCMF